MRGFLLTIALCSALTIAGCGGSDSSSGGSSAPAESINVKPTVDVPSGPPPAELETTELIEGTGREAKSGDEVNVKYVLVDFKTGKEIESNWDTGQDFTFILGTNGVIPGWEEGVEGMKVGGRRELVIPPDLAYGKQKIGPIKPNSTLVFVVDLKRATPSG